MNDRQLVSSRPRALVVVVAALLVWASVAAVASAAPNKKTYTASVNPSALIAGHTYAGATQIAFTIQNKSTSAALGSANVTVPVGIAASDVDFSGDGTAELVGTTVELRNLALAPNESATVSVSAQVECGSNNAPYIWTTRTKQSNDFNGTGNDLSGNSPTSSVVGTCGLAFTEQPAHSEKSPTTIRGKIYDPAGPAVTVTVLDGAADQTVTWWSGTVDLSIGDDPTAGASLTGGISGAPSNGVVTFTPSIDLSATGFSLVATATPTAGTPSVGTSDAGVESNNFNIVDDAEICAALVECDVEAGVGQRTSAHVLANGNGADGDLVILTIDDPAVSLHCNGYNATSDVVVFDVTDSGGVIPSNRSKIATLTLAAASVTKSASKYKVCYDDGSGPILLSSCANPTPAPPCIVSKALDKDKNLVVVISSPSGDPKLLV